MGLLNLRAKFVLSIGLLGLLGFMLPSSVQADDIMYTVNQTVGLGSVTGSITTDGTIGTLSSSDVVGWNLTLNDGHGDMFDLTTANSLVTCNSCVEGDLTASSSALMFNFSGPTEEFYFYTSGPAANQLCYDSGTNCAIPAGIDLYDVAGALPCTYYGCNVGEVGNQVIASDGTPTPTPTPEPSSFLLLGTGILTLVGMGWRRNSQSSGSVVS
jgi:hypothetical protein